MGACISNKSEKSHRKENAVDPSRKRLSVSKSEQVPPKSEKEKEKVAVKTIDKGSILDLFPESRRRMCVLGTTSEIQQKGYADKKVQRSSAADTEKASDCKIGYACKKGLKPESPNQDDFCIFVTDSFSMFGVFDGHGPYGHDISNYAHEMLPETLVKDPRFSDEPEQLQQALKEAFPSTHHKCTDEAEKGHFDCALSGTTATLVLLKQGSLYAAHVGDSRAVLAKSVQNSIGFKAHDLTQDHKPDCEAECRRIVASGRGQVRRLEGDIPKRVFLKDRMYPGLAMTRSIGDTVGVDAGVISTPDVICRTIESDWSFLLLCSDGVWEFISSQEAVDIVSRFAPSDCQNASEALASEAWDRWIKEEHDVVDDITVILYWFKGNS